MTSSCTDKGSPMKKFHIRPFFLIAMSFAVGILLGVYVKTNSVISTILFCLIGGIFLFFTIFLFIKRADFLTYKKILVTCCCIIFVFLGVGSLTLEVVKCEASYISTEAWISATVSDKVYENEQYMTLYLRNVSIAQDESGDTSAATKLNGYARCYLPLGSLPNDVPTGSRIVLFGKITSSEIFIDNKIDTRFYKKDIEYIISGGSVISFSTEGAAPTLTENIRTSIKQTIYDKVGAEDGGILFALMFGDKTEMDVSTKKAFAESGIIHVFAVSGLHVGFLAAALGKLLEKIKLNKKVGFFISLAVFFLYALLCDFSPSVVRAAIMALVVQLATLSGRRYDFLSSMSFAALIILIFKPLYLFDVGFLYTFACVFGIATLMPLFERLLKGMPKFLRFSLAMSLSIQLALLPLSALFSGYFSVFAALLNIIAIPMIGITFFVLFGTVILSFVFPFLTPILCLPKLAVSFLSYVSNAVVASQVAVIILTSFGALAIGFYVLMFLGRYLLLNRDKKVVVCFAVAAVFLAITVLTNLPKNESLLGKNTLSAVQDKDGFACVVTTEEENCYLFVSGGSKNILDNLAEMTGRFKIEEFDAVIVCELTEVSVAVVESVCLSYQVGGLILPYSEHFTATDAMYISQISIFGVPIDFAEFEKFNVIDFGDLTVSYLGEGRCYSVSASFGGVNALFLNDVSEAQLQFVFDFVVSEPTIVVLHSVADATLMRFHEALIVFGNRAFNYFDADFDAKFATALENSATTNTTPLTLMLEKGRIVEKR